jgi:hypothetical protein
LWQRIRRVGAPERTLVEVNEKALILQDCEPKRSAKFVIQSLHTYLSSYVKVSVGPRMILLEILVNKVCGFRFSFLVSTGRSRGPFHVHPSTMKNIII